MISSILDDAVEVGCDGIVLIDQGSSRNQLPKAEGGCENSLTYGFAQPVFCLSLHRYEMQEPRYLSDHRYPGPSTHPCPSYIEGLPTQAELDAHPRMFTWGELKEIVTSGVLERLMRNKQMQERYDIWSMGIKREYGSTG